MNWISVAERLPERWGIYLVCYGPANDYLLATWDDANGVWRCDEDWGLIATVKYWAEITAPEEL